LDGAIKATWGASENNRKAKYYQLTRRGRTVLVAEQKTWNRLSGAVARVLAR
jgi:DNA-binding PadR family transcriptional regulator